MKRDLSSSPPDRPVVRYIIEYIYLPTGRKYFTDVFFDRYSAEQRAVKWKNSSIYRFRIIMLMEV